MIDAQYAILKYVADPMRGESLNIGILVWTEASYELVVDKDALGRVLLFNPHLDRSVFDHFTEYLQAQLGNWHGQVGNLDWSTNALPYPVQMTEPIYTSLEGSIEDTQSLGQMLFAEAASLSSQLVRLRKRKGATRRFSPQASIRTLLQPQIDSNHVREHYSVKGRLTGDPREISFFANSGVNVGLDIVRLPPGKVGGDLSLVRTADAAAYGLQDVIRSESVRAVVSYLPVDFRADTVSLIEPLETRLSLIGVPLFQDKASAVSAFRELAGFDPAPIAAD